MSTSAARAALGPQAPVHTPARLAYVTIEKPPAMNAVCDPYGSVVGQYPLVDDDLGLTDRMADRLREVCDLVDGSACEAAPCAAAQAEPVGWVSRSGSQAWAPVTLVQRDRRVIAVCARCAPTALYGRLWSED